MATAIKERVEKSHDELDPLIGKTEAPGASPIPTPAQQVREVGRSVGQDLQIAFYRSFPYMVVILGLGLVTMFGLWAKFSTHPQAKAISAPAPAHRILPAHSVKVVEGEMFLHTSATQVAGKVTFHVTNNGGMHHEFVIVSGDPAGTKGDEPGRVSERRHIGGDEGPEIGDIRPGQTKSLTVRLAPGTYTAMCNLPGHYMAGMHFKFVVA